VKHMTMARNVAILIFDEVEVLDFCGPFEVFGVTGRTAESTPFNVYTVAEKSPILTRNGLSVNPTYTLDNCLQPNILLVPGGFGTRREINNTRIITWIKEQFPKVELMLSVCTGAMLLGKAGLLDGLSATTHFLAEEELRAVAPKTTICLSERYVDNGKVITSAGISAGIDMALYTVGRLLGGDVATETARRMQYDYWKGS